LNNNYNENQEFTAPPLDDETFIKNVIEYAATCDESIIEDVFNLPPHLEETLAPFMSFAEPNNGTTDNHSKEPSVEVATPEEASKLVCGDDEELMEVETATTLDDYRVPLDDPQTISNEPRCTAITEVPATVNAEPLSQHQTSPRKPNVLSSMDTTWTLDVDVDDYHMPQPSSQADFNFPVAYTPFTLPIGSTDGDIVVEVAPIPAISSPSRTWTVIKQGPVLSARQPGTQPQFSRVANKRGTSVAKSNSERNSPSSGVLVSRRPCPQAKDQNAKVTCKGGRSVPQSNAERCMTYRKKQQARKEREDEELRTLFEQNRMLKAKEAALKNKISKLKTSLLKIGLGGFSH